MEDRQGKRSSKTSINKCLNVAVSPVNIQMDNHLVIGGTGNYLQEANCKNPALLDPYAERLDLSTPLGRYIRSRTPIVGDAFSPPITSFINSNYRPAVVGHYASSSSGSGSFGPRGGGSSLSPLSAVENLETPSTKSPKIFGTPMKIDEEVIVMDGIPVNSVPGGSRMMRSVSDSGGLSMGKCLYKTDICRSWEDSGSCRYGPKCQFAHGKEELRSARIPIKSKSKFRNSHQLMGAAASEANFIATTNKTELSRRPENLKPKPFSAHSIKDWSPEDDGIKIVLPNSRNGEISKREDVNKHIHDVLHGDASMARTRKRLPVFAEM